MDSDTRIVKKGRKKYLVKTKKLKPGQKLLPGQSLKAEWKRLNPAQEMMLIGSKETFTYRGPTVEKKEMGPRDFLN